jgi:transposase
MGYRRMNIDNLKAIYRRWTAGQNISFISQMEGFDRKTVRNYLKSFEAAGLSKEYPLEENPGLHEILLSLLPDNNRANPVQAGFESYRQEIKKLLSDKDHPVKPKTAFKIIKRKYDIPGSYESFKVFFKKSLIVEDLRKTFPRLEMPLGKETQIDYCTVGIHHDPETGKNRRVYGFIGKLSSSRLPFVEFTYSQKQEEFVESNIRMIEFFGGITEHLTIDNLKSGVIKAHVYDPQLNKAYAEFAEHYGTFINPCIVRHAKGKAKVERQVQEVREMFRELMHIHPTFTLAEINKEALKWCREDYGMKNHGTTGRKPFEVFNAEELLALKPLPPKRFEVPHWKEVKVHADQFFSYEKKRYAMPAKYRGSKLRCRRTGATLKVFDTTYNQLRIYIISKNRVQYCKGDFPESYEAMMKGEYPQYLIRQAAMYGPSSKKLIEALLSNHAFIKARTAKGLLEVMKNYKEQPFLQEICLKALNKGFFFPKQLKTLLEQEKGQTYFEFIVPRSASGEAMIRDIGDYLN